ncbi:MAG: hypothetical protein AAGA20_11355 [Planctomycetota bacterium]
MDSIEQQIHEFRYEAVDGAKPRIVEELSWTEDERILPFLLDVLADQDEYEPARIEAARALMSDIESMREEICDVLVAVLDREHEDGDVRSQALEAAKYFLEDSEELAEAVRFVLEPRFDVADDGAFAAAD